MGLKVATLRLLLLMAMMVSIAGCAALAGADADAILQRLNENLAVANLTGVA